MTACSSVLSFVAIQVEQALKEADRAVREGVLVIMGWTASTVFKAIAYFLLLFGFFFVFM